jgi:hypothetical protein
VTFDFEGLPTQGEWTVQDDPGDVGRCGNPRSTICWRWVQLHTDGGVFSGGLNSDVELTIDPDFKSGIDDWKVITATDNGIKRIALDMDEQLTIRSGDDGDD